jgi:transposase
MWSYISAEERVPKDHPLRPIREMFDASLKELSPVFERLYSSTGRPSIAPEKLLRALLLQVLYTIRSERMLMEQLDYNLLFRWFVGLSMDDRVWVPTVFTKNRDRLLEGDIARALLEKALDQARERKLLSEDHFSVDGTLIEAWASQKSFKKKDDRSSTPSSQDPGNPSVDFRGEKRTNETHQSTTDPEARLFKKARGLTAKLSFMGHLLIENRHGLVIDSRLTQATGTAEREAALQMAERVSGGTLGADRKYDTKDFVRELRGKGITPHVVQDDACRRSAIDGRTTRHEGYRISLRKRKLVEEVFGWMKTVGLMRKTRHRGVSRVGWMFTFTAAAFNLIRIRTLDSQAA